MTSALNPENGTSTYTYNTDGTVFEVTDARNQKTRYQYDNLKRVKDILRYPAGSGNPDNNQTVTLAYDTSPVGYGSNLQGRLSAVTSYAVGTGTDLFTFTERFGYTAAGLRTHKKLDVIKTITGGYYAGGSLESVATYAPNGRMLTETTPVRHYWNGSQWVALGGPYYVYQHDVYGQVTQMNDNATPVVSGVQYNAAGQIKEMSYEGWTETREYNERNQLTRIKVPGVFDTEYIFHGTQNNGRITQQKNWISGETVTYTYDALNRLIQASGAGGTPWSQVYEHDGFGNLTRKGGGSWLVDAATNRLMNVPGVTYDANGNQYGAATQYDIANRLITWDGNQKYGYGADNRRIYTWDAVDGELITFWSLGGKRMETFTPSPNYTSTTIYWPGKSKNVWFGGKLVRTARIGNDQKVVVDRLGSVRYRYTYQTMSAETLDYYPYGDEKPGTTAQGREKFATYHRDLTGMDYADQRYYRWEWGRFGTVDHSGLNEGAMRPASWNRYSYVESDPANANDPTGLTFKDWFGKGLFARAGPSASVSDSGSAEAPGAATGPSPTGFAAVPVTHEVSVGAGGPMAGAAVGIDEMEAPIDTGLTAPIHPGESTSLLEPVGVEPDSKGNEQEGISLHGKGAQIGAVCGVAASVFGAWGAGLGAAKIVGATAASGGAALLFVGILGAGFGLCWALSGF